MLISFSPLNAVGQLSAVNGCNVYLHEDPGSWTFMNFRIISDTQFLAILDGYLILFEQQQSSFKAVNGLKIIDSDGFFATVVQIEVDKNYIYLNARAINTLMKIPLSIFENYTGFSQLNPFLHCFRFFFFTGCLKTKMDFI